MSDMINQIPTEVRRRFNEEPEYFVEWWDENRSRWLWGRGSWELANCCSPYFEYWWDKDKFQYNGSTCTVLATNTYQYYEEWFDPDKFVYSWGCFNVLARNCSEYFEQWFNSDMLEALTSDAEAYYDEGIFDYSISSNLITYCWKYFDIWWDKYIKASEISGELISNCPDKFEVWFRPDDFDWYNHGRELRDKLQQYKHIWEPHYVENML